MDNRDARTGTALRHGAVGNAHIAVDIGSTLIKVARIDGNGRLAAQTFHDRDPDAAITGQVDALLASIDAPAVPLFCSSANGGLRVGIVCLTSTFSGSVFRNQVLLAGANPMFVHTFEEARGDLRPVDVLLVGGGIDCDDAGPLRDRLPAFDATGYRYTTLMYAGNRALAEGVRTQFPSSVVVGNPLAEGLSGRTLSVWRALRDAYLNDIVHKDGVQEIVRTYGRPIWPTPEVVNAGFRRILSCGSDIQVGSPCMLLDIGGATTDIHYTVEIVRPESENQPQVGTSIARYVFTDLGVKASRDTTLLQLRSHGRGYDYLSRVLDGDVQGIYKQMREGGFEPTTEIVAGACLFLALDRFFRGAEPGLPTVEPERITQIMVTGGGGLAMTDAIITRIVESFFAGHRVLPSIFVDRAYRIWTEGITGMAEDLASDPGATVPTTASTSSVPTLRQERGQHG